MVVEDKEEVECISRTLTASLEDRTPECEEIDLVLRKQMIYSVISLADVTPLLTSLMMTTSLVTWEVLALDNLHNREVVNSKVDNRGTIHLVHLVEV